jgi:hypothetical protein|tara:strand:- start:714 stop:1154 length:441 start_codon:yes stop_codon:yes gene_type:complete
MEIKDFLNKWKTYSDPMNLDLSNVYSVLFCKKDGGISDILSNLDIDEEDLLNCDGEVKEEILQSLKTIDGLMNQTTVVMKDYIIETIFNEVDDETVLEKYQTSNQSLNPIYKQIVSEFNKIKEILFNHYPPSFSVNFTVDGSGLEI